MESWIGGMKVIRSNATCCTATNKKKSIQITLRINDREGIATERIGILRVVSEKTAKAKDEINACLVMPQQCR